MSVVPQAPPPSRPYTIRTARHYGAHFAWCVQHRAFALDASRDAAVARVALAVALALSPWQPRSFAVVHGVDNPSHSGR